MGAFMALNKSLLPEALRRIAVLRSFARNHLIHHGAQLGGLPALKPRPRSGALCSLRRRIRNVALAISAL